MKVYIGRNDEKIIVVGSSYNSCFQRLADYFNKPENNGWVSIEEHEVLNDEWPVVSEIEAAVAQEGEKADDLDELIEGFGPPEGTYEMPEPINYADIAPSARAAYMAAGNGLAAIVQRDRTPPLMDEIDEAGDQEAALRLSKIDDDLDESALSLGMAWICKGPGCHKIVDCNPYTYKQPSLCDACNRREVDVMFERLFGSGVI